MLHRFKSLKLFLVLGLLLCLPFTAVATNDPSTLVFNIGSGGNISFSGSGSLIATNLNVLNVFGKNTTLHNGETLTITGGLLSFTSGTYTGGGSKWSWDNNSGSITMTGNISTPITAGPTLVSGSKVGGEVDLSGRVLRFAYSGFSDTVSSQLSSYFGLSGSKWIGELGTPFISSAKEGKAFSGTPISGQLLTTPTPIPAVVWLLGAGLMGLAGIRRRSNG